MKLRLISGWLPHWLPLLGALIVIGIAFDLVTRSRLSATTGMICEANARHPQVACAISNRARAANTAT
jgi:hypothetical protein